MSNEKKGVSEYEARNLLNDSFLPEHWRIKVPPRDERTLVEKIRQKTTEYLDENKGVALMTLMTYATSRGSGKTHEQALKDAAFTLKHGKEMEKNMEDMYNWLVKKIRGL